jgi:hypothetical protein
MRRPAEMPREWGLVAFFAAVCLLIVTWARFHFLIVLPVLALVMAAVLIYRGMSVMDYWPVVALSSAILVYGATLAFQTNTFISSVHDMNSEPADMARRTQVAQNNVLDNISDLLVPKHPTVLKRNPYTDILMAPLPAARPATITLPELQHVTHFQPTPTPEPLALIPTAETPFPAGMAPVPAPSPPSGITTGMGTERRLELSLSASVGFWTTVGLLAIWALRRKASDPADAGPGL